MARASPYVLMAAAAALALAASGKRRRRGHRVPDGNGVRPPRPGPGPMPEPMTGGQTDIRYLAEWAFLDEEWIVFLEATAAGESRFNNFVGLGNPALFPDWAQPNLKASQKSQKREAEAAGISYDRNDYLAGCDWPRSRYVFGSGGWFGALPGNAVAAFKGTRYECIDPWSVFDPVSSLVEIVEYCRRIMRWDNFKANPTWLNLRVGVGSPSNMNKPDKLARMEEKFRDKLLELGYSASFMYGQVMPLPSDNPADLLDALTEVF